MKTKVLLGIKRLLASVMILIMCLGSMNLTALAEGIEEVLDYSIMEEVNDHEQEEKPDFEEGFIDSLSEEQNTENIDEIQTVSVYENEGLKYTFTLYSSWDTGYNASIRIDNNTENIIDDWKIEMLYDGSVSSVWNAVIVSGDNGKYVIKNNDWNQDIYPGSYVEFGLSGQEGFNTFPTSYRMLNIIKSNSSEDYFVEYNVMYDWGAGFTGRVTINNNSDTTIEDWVLEFDSENEISNVWDSVIVSEEGLHYVVKNPGYNQNIAPGGSVSFGFNVNEKLSENEFSNYELKSYTEYVQEQEEEEIIPDPDEEDEEQKEGLGYYIPLPENYDDLPEPGSFDSIGEVWIKESTEEDIVIDDSGIQYVKNQILISAYMGADKEIFDDIAEEIGANIVGYIELTNDYQLEFTEDKTFEELNTIIDYLNGYSFISDVTLNYCSIMEPTDYIVGEDFQIGDLYNDGYYCKKIDDLYLDSELYEEFDGKIKINKNNRTEDPSGTVFYKSITADNWNENSPHYDNWGLETLKVQSAWNKIDKSTTVKVGVFDVGFSKHKDINYYAMENNPETTSSYVNDYGFEVQIINTFHGTHVSGIIAANHNDDYGIMGVANDVQLYAYSCGSDGAVSFIEGKKALAYLIGNRVKVINISLGFEPVISYAATRENKNAIDYVEAYSSGMTEFLNKMIYSGYDFVICCSAGNTEKERFIEDWNSDYGYRLPSADENGESGKVESKWNSPFTAVDENSEAGKRIIVVAAINPYDYDDKCYYRASYSNSGTRVDVVAPGTEILSTVPTEYDPCGYAFLDGTSMSTPYITGIVALMYEINPYLQAELVKKYLKYSSSESCQYGIYMIPDAEKCVELAKEYIPTDINDIQYPSGIIIGNTRFQQSPIGKVKFTAYRKGAVDEVIDSYDKGIYRFEFESYEKPEDINREEYVGDFEEVLPEGVYDILVWKDGFLPFCISDVSICRDEVLDLGTIYLKEWKGNIEEHIQGTVINAETGDFETDVTVRVRKGWNNRYGKIIRDISGRILDTHNLKDGRVELLIPTGAYTIELRKEGFITEYYNVISSGENENILMIISPFLSDDDYRIVLTWNDIYDLDAHLSYYQKDVRILHCSYDYRNIKYSDEQTITLDLDKRWNGPETITITNISKFMQDGGVFKFSVHSYSNFNEYDSYIWDNSNAKVKVYSGNNLLKTYYVPNNRVGTVWHVLDLSKEGIERVDEFYNVSNIYDIK